MAGGIITCNDGQVAPDALLKFAKSQADYILGKNPNSISYLVGYGSSYSTHVYHRGASIPSISTFPSVVGCIDGFDYWFLNKNNNPNVIVGALVGGPDSTDAFHNERCRYEQTEPSIAGNAPLVGLFAALDCFTDESGGHSSSGSGENSSRNSHADPNKTAPVAFVHTISHTWKYKAEDLYRHQVVVKNTRGKAITYLKLRIEGLSGPLWGLSEAAEKGTYVLPSWEHALEADSELVIVYIQGGAQARISVVAYTEAE